MSFSRKECAAYLAGLPVSFRYEYLMAETIFSQVLWTLFGSLYKVLLINAFIFLKSILARNRNMQKQPFWKKQINSIRLCFLAAHDNMQSLSNNVSWIHDALNFVFLFKDFYEIETCATKNMSGDRDMWKKNMKLWTI